MQIIVKIFLVLCCDTKTPDGTYVYQVKDVNSSVEGVMYTNLEYTQGDTIYYRIKK